MKEERENVLAKKLIGYAEDALGNCKRSLLDICDIYESRHLSEAEKDAFGKLKKRVHNDVGSALSQLKADIMNITNGVEIPRFGEHNDKVKHK